MSLAFPTQTIWAIMTIALATTAGASLLFLLLAGGDRLNELTNAYGPNLIIQSNNSEKGIPISLLPKISQSTWGNQILNMAPIITGIEKVSFQEKDNKERTPFFSSWFQKKSFHGQTTDILQLYPWWGISQGRWPRTSEVVISKIFSKKNKLKLGRKILIQKRPFLISGIFNDNLGKPPAPLMISLRDALKFPGQNKTVNKILLRVLLQPEDALSQRARLNLSSLSADQMEKFTCRPYFNAVAQSLTASLPGTQIFSLRQSAQGSQTLLLTLRKMTGWFLFAAIAIIFSAISVISFAGGSLRKKNLGILRILGATRLQSALLLIGEASWISFLGGVIGIFSGGLLSCLFMSVFYSKIRMPQPFLVILLLPSIVLISILTVLPPIFSMLKKDFFTELRNV